MDTSSPPLIMLAQLGGQRFITMTGAKDLVGGADYLMFSLPRGLAKDRINKVKITIMPSDTYKLEFMEVDSRKLSVRNVDVAEDIYADKLQECFSRVTGLVTRL